MVRIHRPRDGAIVCIGWHRCHNPSRMHADESKICTRQPGIALRSRPVACAVAAGFRRIEGSGAADDAVVTFVNGARRDPGGRGGASVTG